MLSERRFVILEYRPDDYDMGGMPSITESELKRRLSILKIPVNLDLAIEIITRGFEGEPILHGEGKEQERTSQCPNCGKIGGCDCYSKGYLDQPSPAPTEWEAWFEEKPSVQEAFIESPGIYSLPLYDRLITKWLKKIPRK